MSLFLKIEDTFSLEYMNLFKYLIFIPFVGLKLNTLFQNTANFYRNKILLNCLISHELRVTALGGAVS